MEKKTVLQTKSNIQEALLKFIDFIYALVFTFIIRQSFSDIIDSDKLPRLDKISRLLLLAAVFYFLAWDWILGRILTIRNPYKSYTRFFLEVVIASFAYGTSTVAIAGRVSFLVYFSGLLFFGCLWGYQTARQLLEPRDSQEICVIQQLQLVGTIVTLTFFAGWRTQVSKSISWELVLSIVFYLWFFMLIYEMTVPRYGGISAGPGVPFLARPNLRKVRRFLFKNLDNL